MAPVSGCVSSLLSIIYYTIWLQSIVDAIIPITNPCPTPKQIDCFFVNVTEKEKGVHFQGHQYYVTKKDCENNAKCTSCIEMTHGVVRDAAMKVNELYVNALWAVVARTQTRGFSSTRPYSRVSPGGAHQECPSCGISFTNTSWEASSCSACHPVLCAPSAPASLCQSARSLIGGSRGDLSCLARMVKMVRVTTALLTRHPALIPRDKNK